MESTYLPAPTRYDHANFRRCGNSGLVLPAITLGLWQNFGGADVFETGRAMVRRAFDRGVTHFDLANNYGPPYGSAEENFGTILRKDSVSARILAACATSSSSPPRPAGTCGPALTASAPRANICSPRSTTASSAWASTTSTSSTRIGPGKTARSKKPWARLSPPCIRARRSMSASRPTAPTARAQAAKILKSMGVPLLIHQPSYSMLNRWIEKGLLATLEEVGAGCIAFSPLAQGLLTSKYLKGIPKDSRAKHEGSSLLKEFLSEKNLKHVRALNEIAQGRGQTLAQMAIAWVLRDQRVTSALIGARNVEQLDDSLDALKKLKFTAAELQGNRPPCARGRRRPVAQRPRANDLTASACFLSRTAFAIGIERRKERTMIVGVPKEIKDNEARVGVTPAGVKELTEAGHKVLVETQAGAQSGFPDAEYQNAGAEIVGDAGYVWGKSEMVVKVKEPIEQEYVYFREGLVLFTYLHLAPLPALTDKLLESKVIGIAYETVRDRQGNSAAAHAHERGGGAHERPGGRQLP